MVSLTNIASVSTAVSDALKLSTKPTDLYDPKNPSAEAAAKYTLSSMADVVNTAEKYYNPNVDKEIATIVKLSKEAQLNNIPETTFADRGFINGDFLVTHKAGFGRPDGEQNALSDPWGVYRGYAGGTDIVAAVRSPAPASDHIAFMTDNLTSFERIRAESQYGSVNKNFALKQFRVSERILDSDKRYYYLIQHSGSFRANLAPTSDEASVGVKIALELRSDFNIYYTYDDRNYVQQTVTTKYRVGLDDKNEIKYGGLTEQTTQRSYIDKNWNNSIDQGYSLTVSLRQTSAYIGSTYNKIDTTVSLDRIVYMGVNSGDNSPEYVQFSSQREKDSVSQLNAPGTDEINTTYHLTTSKLVGLEKNGNISNSIFSIKAIDSSERLVSVSNSDNGIKAASDASLSSRLSFDNSSDDKTLRAQTGKNAAVLQYNPITEAGYYTIGGGGISIYPGLTQPMRGSTPIPIPYVSKSFKKMDIPSIYPSSGDARINGDSQYSLRLDVNLKNTTNYSKASGDSSSLFITPYGTRNGVRVQSGRIFLNVIGNLEQNIVSTGPYGASIPNMGSQSVFFLTSFSPGSSGNPNNFYGLSTSNGRGPFHIINNKLYSYKQGTLDQNKYFRITV
jgi:hypothetical protein